jgi:hypothetical protein
MSAGPSPIVIDFIVRGIPNVMKAMKSIADTVTQTERQSAVAVQAGTSARAKEREKEARAAAKAYADTAKLAAAAQRTGTKSVEQELKIRLANQARHLVATHKAEQDARKKSLQDAAASQKAQYDNARNYFKAQIAEHDKAEAQKRAIRERSARMAGAFAEKQANAEARVSRQVSLEEKKLRLEALRGGGSVKPSLSPQARLAVLAQAKGKSPEEQQAALDKVRGMGAEAKVRRKLATDEATEERRQQDAKTREVEQAEKRRFAIRQRSAIMAGRFAEQQVREETRARKKAEAEVEAKRERFAKTVTGAGGSAVRSATSIVGGVTRGAVGGAFQVGGGFSLADSVQRRVTMRGNLADIANRAVIKGDPENEKRVSVDELQSQVSSVGMRYAIDPEQATAGLDKFASKTGNLARGRELLSGLAEMSRAGAGSLDDLSDAAGDVFNADKTQNAQQVLAVMRALSPPVSGKLSPPPRSGVRASLVLGA